MAVDIIWHICSHENEYNQMEQKDCYVGVHSVARGMTEPAKEEKVFITSDH
jgi:hypothetical protein